MSARSPLHVLRTTTPIGPMIAVADDLGVRILEFCDRDAIDWVREQLQKAGESRQLTSGDHLHLSLLFSELAEFFAGGRRVFSVPLAPLGSAFQRRAWAYLTTIPYAQTRTYGQQARALGDPSAVRAVGRANGANPLAIVVPCHRVIGATGDLTGYAAGLERKRWLLEHEQRVAGNLLFETPQAPRRRRASRCLAAS